MSPIKIAFVSSFTTGAVIVVGTPFVNAFMQNRAEQTLAKQTDLVVDPQNIKIGIDGDTYYIDIEDNGKHCLVKPSKPNKKTQSTFINCKIL